MRIGVIGTGKSGQLRATTIREHAGTPLAAACGESATDAAGSSAGGSGAQVGSTGGAFGLGGGAGASSDASSDSDNGSAYPSGPHGTQVGDVLANMNLLGYLRDATTGLASEAGLAPLSFASIRASTQKKHVVFHVSGFT